VCLLFDIFLPLSFAQIILRLVRKLGSRSSASPVNRLDPSGHEDADLASFSIASGVGTTIFGLSVLQSQFVIGAVTGALFASSFAGIGASLEGQSPDQIEGATGNPWNIAPGALLGAAGSYATAFRLGRAVLVLASLAGGGSAAYNDYQKGNIAAAVYYGALGLGGAFLSAQSSYIALKGPIPDVVPTNLSEQLVLEEAAANADVIIDNVDLGDAPRLEAVYGDGEWVKMSWTHQVEGAPSGVAGQSGRFEVHFFKNIDTGQTVEFKFKGR
jgi:hypothetical protein